MALLIVMFMPTVLYATDEQQEESKESIYDSLQESIKENWEEGFKDLEKVDEIEIKGPLQERIIRSVANVFYSHLFGIKAWSLLIGIISIVIGGFVSVTAKLNKKLRKYAIVVFIVGIPVLLIIFVFGVTKMVSMFI